MGPQACSCGQLNGHKRFVCQKCGRQLRAFGSPRRRGRGPRLRGPEPVKTLEPFERPWVTRKPKPVLAQPGDTTHVRDKTIERRTRGED